MMKRMIILPLFFLIVFVGCNHTGHTEKIELKTVGPVVKHDSLVHPVCWHTAVFAAMVYGTQGYEVRIVRMYLSDGYHAQAIVKIKGEWYWLHAEVTPDSITPLSNLNGEIKTVNIFTLDDYIKDVQVRWAH